MVDQTNTTALVYDAQGAIKGARDMRAAADTIIEANREAVAANDATTTSTRRLQEAQDALASRQRALADAQRAAARAIADYGAGSAEAARATERVTSANTAMEQAATRLQTAQDASVQRTERVTVALANQQRMLTAIAARYAPAIAEEQRFTQTQEKLNRTIAAGGANAGLAQRILDSMTPATRRAAEAQEAGARSAGLQAYQLQNLSYQIQDAATQLAGGTSPFLILMQQGPQAAEAVGGFGAALGYLASPLGVAIAGAAGVAAGLALIASRGAQIREVDRVVTLLGNGLGQTRAQMEAMAHQAAAAGGVSVSAARTMQAAYAGAGTISATVMRRLIADTRQYATATGQDVDAATADLAGLFKDPVKGASDLADRYNLLSEKEVTRIGHLSKSADIERAQIDLITAIEARTAGAVEKTTKLAQLWQSVKTGLADAGEAIAAHLSGGESALEDRIARLEAAKPRLSAVANPVAAARGYTETGQVGDVVAYARLGGDARLAQLKAEQAAEAGANAASADDAKMKALSRSVQEVSDAYADAAGQLRAVDTQLAAVTTLLASPKVDAYVTDIDAARRAVAALTAQQSDLREVLASGYDVETAKAEKRAEVEAAAIGQYGADVDRLKAGQAAIADAYASATSAADRAAKAQVAGFQATVASVKTLVDAVKGLRDEIGLLSVQKGLDRDIASFRQQVQGALPQAPADLTAAMRAAGARYGVDPALLAGIASRESDFDTNAYNATTRAAGLFQFTPQTAAAYGLANPYDGLASVDAAARYLADLLRRYGGNVDAALKAYGGFVTTSPAAYQADVKTRAAGFRAAWDAPALVAQRNAATVSSNAADTDFQGRLDRLKASAAALPFDQVRRMAEASRAAADAEALLSTSGKAVADAFLTQVESGKSATDALDALAATGLKVPDAVRQTDAALQNSATVDYTHQINDLTRSLQQQEAAQRRTAAAAGLGEAAGRQAEAENAVQATRSTLGDDAARIQALANESAELIKVNALRGEFNRGIEQQVAADQRLAAGYAAGADAGHAAELMNQALAQVMRELPPRIDAAGKATWDYAEANAALAANLGVLKAKDSAAFMVQAAQYFDQQGTQLQAIAAARAATGADPAAIARADADRQVLDWLRQSGRQYDTLSADERALVDKIRERAAAYADANTALDRTRESMQYLQSAAGEVFSTIGSGLTDMITQNKTAAEAVSSIWQSVLSSLINKFIELSIVNPMSNSLFGGSSPTLSSVGGLIGKLFGSGSTVYSSPDAVGPFWNGFNLSANGNIMTPGGPLPLQRYAGGGVATRPQVSIFGEGRQPEAYVPLPDGRSIPVTMTAPTIAAPVINLPAAANAAPAVHLHITNNAAADTRVSSKDATTNADGSLNVRLIVDKLAAENAGTPTSATAKALRTVYGAQQKLVGR